MDLKALVLLMHYVEHHVQSVVQREREIETSAGDGKVIRGRSRERLTYINQREMMACNVVSSTSHERSALK